MRPGLFISKLHGPEKSASRRDIHYENFILAAPCICRHYCRTFMKFRSLKPE